MTLIDLIKLGLIKSDAVAERFASALVRCWHEDRIPGELNDILGLLPREYQAWTTGRVSLLTIALWQKTSHPPLDTSKPWFKLAGRPPKEIVGYQTDRKASNGSGRSKRRTPRRSKRADR
jgi:hypothetical protein